MGRPLFLYCECRELSSKRGASTGQSFWYGAAGRVGRVDFPTTPQTIATGFLLSPRFKVEMADLAAVFAITKSAFGE
jgi:hypothetical protein